MSKAISIEELLSALARKSIPLPFEMGTFIVLEATEQVLVEEATGSNGMPLLGLPDVELGEQGEVAVNASKRAATEEEACRALVSLLGELLVRSAPGVTPMLLEIVEQGPSDHRWTLLRLRDDLESALVPLNRGAMRRVLGRLLREARRDDRSRSAPPPDVDDLEGDLDELLGMEHKPQAARPRTPRAAPLTAAESSGPARAAALPSLRVREREVARDERPREDATVDVDLPELEPLPVRKRESQATTAGPAARAPRLDLGSAPPRTIESPDTLDEFERAASGGRGGLRLGLVLGLLALGLLAAFLGLGRERVQRVLGMKSPAETAPAPAVPPPRKPKPKVGELRVTSTPERAQVLMLVGTAPAVVTKLPVGIAYEFVALAPGYKPSRAVVPASAPWPEDGGEPRYELALQLGEASAGHGENELGATRLTSEMGQATGALGSVRVITSPPGAKVYQLIGFTPDARVENISTETPIDLLVYLEGAAPVPLHVTEADFKPEGAGLAAEVSASLSVKAKRH